MGEVALHKVGETENGIVVRGARMLATLAPFADELTIYPGSDIRPQDGNYALSFAHPDGRRRGSSSSAATATRSSAAAFDYPLSSRFDEMDAVAIFDDVEVPKDRVFLRRRHRRLLRGHHRHRLARPHHAPGVHARLRQALVRVRPRPHDRQHDRRRPLRPHPGEARPDLEHGRADPLGAGRRPRRARRSTRAASGTPTTARSWRCAARCRSGCRTSTSCCS